MGKERLKARHMLLAAIFLSSVGFCENASATPKEALMLRRITEYWKDGDYGTVKKQLVDFLEKNPDTALYDHLNAMLGDIYFQERNFRSALATYDLIANPEIKEKTFFNHLQAQFEMRDYLSVIASAEKFFREKRGMGTEQQVKVRYLLGEACFRHALQCSDMSEKTHYLKIAKPHYKILSQTKYSERVLFPLAEIHRLLREDERAAKLYLKLADKYPEHRERFLFQAGILQIKEDKRAALHTFYKVHEMGGKRSKLAAFNRLILQYQNEDYEGFLSFYDSVIGQMPEQKVPLLKFYEGRCHYALGDYQQAVMPLENFVTQSKGRSKELKTAYLLLVNCSRYLKDIALLERTLYSFKTSFPKDAEVPKVLMIHSQMCRESGNFNQALNDLKILTTNYPGYEDAEGVMYDHGLLLSQMDRWMEAREIFLSFLEKYPQSEKKGSAWRHLLNSSIEEIKNPSQESSLASKETFMNILEKALVQEKVFTEREKRKYSIVLLKCKCELDRYEEAFPILSQYLNDGIEPEFLADAHYLMALCQQKLNSDIAPFLQHGEEALRLNPNIEGREVLHLELYNAYLAKAAVSDDHSNKDYFFKNAASHLFASKAWEERSIKLDNYLWLANHFYKSALKSNEKEDFDRACTLFNDLLGLEEGKNQISLSSDSLQLEGEVLKYAHLLMEKEKKKEVVSLLEKLVRKQEEQPQLPWKMQRRAVLELAKAYEANGQTENALNSYRFLVNSKEGISSMVTHTAQLHLARLEFNLLRPMQRVNENPDVIAILHTLKDLQIQKKLRAEPLHLEAAVQYAEMRISMTDPKSYAKNAHFFYKRIIDDFHGSEDPLSEQYNNMRAEFPEKDQIFTAYMKYLDAQLLTCEAAMSKEAKKLDKAAQYEEEALQLLDQLLANEQPLKPYLYDRVVRAKKELEHKL